MIAWFCQADVCWITPLRDGLNLVAKEYAAARRNRGGVLVLSEFTEPRLCWMKPCSPIPIPIAAWMRPSNRHWKWMKTNSATA